MNKRSTETWLDCRVYVAGHTVVLVPLVRGLLDRDVLGAGRRPVLVPLHGRRPCIKRTGQSFCSGLVGRSLLGGSAAALRAHLLQPTFIYKAPLIPRRCLAPVEQLGGHFQRAEGIEAPPGRYWARGLNSSFRLARFRFRCGRGFRRGLFGFRRSLCSPFRLDIFYLDFNITLGRFALGRFLMLWRFRRLLLRRLSLRKLLGIGLDFNRNFGNHFIRPKG
jgi:hypothetical protein